MRIGGKETKPAVRRVARGLNTRAGEVTHDAAAAAFA
jgi:hypothetical protein